MSGSGISRTLQTMCEHFKALDQPLQTLQSTIDRLIAAGHFRYVHRVLNQHDLLQRRRRNMLKAIYARCMVDLDSQLTLTGAQALVLEELSSLSSEGTRKQLAKAIETMPSGTDLYERASTT
ncbi:MAG: hypothetical protein ACFFBD_19405 [Candidatus Hodarchaeota archaeon]